MIYLMKRLLTLFSGIFVVFVSSWLLFSDNVPVHAAPQLLVCNDGTVINVSASHQGQDCSNNGGNSTHQILVCNQQDPGSNPSHNVEIDLSVSHQGQDCRNAGGTLGTYNPSDFPASTTSNSGSNSNDATFKGDCGNGGVNVSIGINKGGGCIGGNGVNPIYAYLKGIIQFASVLFGILAVLMIIITGIQYITSSGNPAAVAAAKKRLVNVIISIVLFFLMVGILTYLIPGGII